MKQYGWIWIIACLIAGCTNTAPQRPSQRKGDAPNGVWAYVIDRGDAEQPVLAGEECRLRMKVFSLSGKPYTDSDLTVRIGKYELPAAVDENITEWHHGAFVRMFVPWYAAYGIKGTDHIPPYENVIIELNIR